MKLFIGNSNNGSNSSCMEIIGYHGTTLKSAKEICHNEIKINYDKNKWMNDIGPGFYTYIDFDGIAFPNAPYKNAIKYAKTFKMRPDLNLAIVEIVVDVDANKILNLANDQNKGKIQQLFAQIEKRRKELLIPTNIHSGASKRNNQDGYKLEFAIKHNLLPDPQIIVETTHTDFCHVRSNFDNGVEMVIRDLSVIKSKKLIEL